MGYIVRVVVKQSEISEKEKADRVSEFSKAFVTAAVDYYSNKQNQRNRAI